jgi:hypothetical protein
MAGQSDDKMSLKELLARRWKAHREAFRVGRWEDGGETGLVVVDRYLQPPQAIVVGLDGGGRLFAKRLDMSSDAASRAELADIAAATRQGKTLPLREALSILGLGAGASALADLSVRRFAESFADPRISARLPLADLRAAESKRVDDAGLSALRGALDAEALDILAAVDDFQWRDYAYYSDGGEKGVARRQAGKSYPLLSTFMARIPSIRAAIDKREPLGPALQAAFGDGPDGKPRLGKAVLSRLHGLAWPTNGIPHDQIVRALSEIPPDWFPKSREEWDAFCDIHATIGTVLREATGLGPDVLYGGCGGKWVEFRERIARACTDDRPPEGTTEEDAAYFREAIDWKTLEKLPRDKIEAAALESVARLDKLPSERIPGHAVVDWIVRLYAPDTSREALHNACLTTEDMVDAFAKKVLLPLAAQECGLEDVYLAPVQFEAARASAAKVLYSGKSANAIFELSRHFHSQYEHIMEAGADKVEDAEKQRRLEEARRAASLTALGIDHANIPEDGWPPLSAVVQAPNGVYIVPLTDPRLLQDEGRPGHCNNGPRENADGSLGLRHCVGGYSGTCKNGGHILSMRVLTGKDHPTFERLSTAEISPLPYGDTDLKCRQHRGFSNGAPPEAATRAFEWYKEEVAAGRIQLNHDKIRAHVGASTMKVDDVERACGYEWRERRRIEDAMYPWGQYVGKRWRKMGLDEFAKQPEVREVAVQINVALESGTSPGYR